VNDEDNSQQIKQIYWSEMKGRFLKSKWIVYPVFILAVGLLVVLFYSPEEGWKVRSIKDGDTIILENGEEVRYIGIDSPEESQPYFEEAKEFNRKMVEGKRVFLEYDKETKDKYSRTLAYIWVDSLLVNAELVKNGLASVYTHPPNLKHRDCLCSLQTEARRAKIGIWSIPVSGVEKYYIGNKRSTRFHRPSCEYAAQMTDKNKIIFKTKEEALDSGYSPCRTCRP
jgi:micrococcal nuclease